MDASPPVDYGDLVSKTAAKFLSKISVLELPKSEFAQTIDRCAEAHWPEYRFDTRFNILAGECGAEVTTWKRKDGAEVEKKIARRIRQWVSGFSSGWVNRAAQSGGEIRWRKPVSVQPFFEGYEPFMQADPHDVVKPA